MIERANGFLSGAKGDMKIYCNSFCIHKISVFQANHVSGEKEGKKKKKRGKKEKKKGGGNHGGAEPTAAERQS